MRRDLSLSRAASPAPHRHGYQTRSEQERGGEFGNERDREAGRVALQLAQLHRYCSRARRGFSSGRERRGDEPNPGVARWITDHYRVEDRVCYTRAGYRKRFCYDLAGGIDPLYDSLPEADRADPRYERFFEDLSRDARHTITLNLVAAE